MSTVAFLLGVLFMASGIAASIALHEVGHLVPRLLAEGKSLRAVARRRATLEARGWHGVEIVEADALKPMTIMFAASDRTPVRRRGARHRRPG